MLPLHRPLKALDPAEADRRSTRKPWLWSVDGVALTSLLVVTVSVITGVTVVLDPVVVPCTMVVAYGFWYAGRRITRVRDMALYCLVGGAVTGAVNACLALGLWSMLGGGYFLRDLEVDVLGIATLMGAATGVAYGCAYLLPMLIQVPARPLHRKEGGDRSLVCYGLWGVIVLALGLSLVAGAEGAGHGLVPVVVAASSVLHLLMVLLGTTRWARRRWWLGRVLKGKVHGWLVCDSQRFHAGELEGLQIFSCPLFARPPAHRPLGVLAEGDGDGTDAYRTTPLTPKYFVR